MREDRLPLPMVAARESATGGALSLSHEQPDGGTFLEERGTRRVIDGRLQFGSVGVLQPGGSEAGAELAFQFPGSEGSRTYMAGGRDRHAGWANRSHPLQTGPGGLHSYSLRFSLHGCVPAHPCGAANNTFASVVQSSWRSAFAHANPTPPRGAPNHVRGPRPPIRRLLRHAAEK